jgi:hypothetical protein
MEEGKDRRTWNNHTAPIAAGFGNQVPDYDQVLSRSRSRHEDGEDLTTGDEAADWAFAQRLCQGAEIA